MKTFAVDFKTFDRMHKDYQTNLFDYLNHFNLEPFEREANDSPTEIDYDDEGYGTASYYEEGFIDCDEGLFYVKADFAGYEEKSYDDDIRRERTFYKINDCVQMEVWKLHKSFSEKLPCSWTGYNQETFRNSIEILDPLENFYLSGKKFLTFKKN